MTALLERVARAICVARGDDPDKPVYQNGCPESGVLYLRWMAYREEAQAALDEIHVEEALAMLESVEAAFRDESGVFAKAGHTALAKRALTLADLVAGFLAKVGPV